MTDLSTDLIKNLMDYKQKLHEKFDHAGRDNSSLQELAKKIEKRLGPEVPNDHVDELMQLYAYLALTSGAQTTNEEVHDAWAYWTLVDRKDPDHKSLKPFDELDETTQAMDTEYRDAIRAVARERRASAFWENYDAQVPADFRRLTGYDSLAGLKISESISKPGQPLYYLWVFDPQEDKVHLEHNEDRHPAEHIDHSHLAERVPHPDRIHGFAYRIQGGWRITTWEHRPVDDPHVLDLVRKKLKREDVDAP